MTNSSAGFDPELHVACATDTTAPPNSSFCVEGPWTIALGAGRYQISLKVGTIW